MFKNGWESGIQRANYMAGESEERPIRNDVDIPWRCTFKQGWSSQLRQDLGNEKVCIYQYVKSFMIHTSIINNNLPNLSM